MEEERLGAMTLRWQADGAGGFVGVINQGGKRIYGPVIAPDRAQIMAALRNQAGRLHPNYFGFDGAIKRFLSFMPDGLHGGLNEHEERGYKETAARALHEVLPIEAALHATNDDAVRVAKARCWTNLLSPFESMRFKDTLNGPQGGAFLRHAAQFADADYSGGGAGMEAAMRKHGRISWPIATYLPYLWAYDRHMFLKPMVTIDFAERVGHRFAHAYDSSINGRTYEVLLDLVDVTGNAIAALNPRDNIDIQSFIWVVGEYRDDDGTT